MRLALALFAAALASPAAATLEECARTDKELDRLACYDRLSGRTPIATTQAEGDWQIETETSALTDETNVYLSVASDEPIHCSWGSGAVTLMLRCQENTTSLILITPCHVADHRDYGVVDYRVDGETAHKFLAEESTNNRSLGLWTGASSIPVINHLLGRQTLTTRFTPYGENPKTVTFNVNGLKEAIMPLREACHW